MPTADRTTVKSALDSLLALLRGNLVADPPTAAKPLRRIETGDFSHDAFAGPFMMVFVDRLRAIGVISDDRLIEASVTWRIVLNTTQRDPVGVTFDVVGAVDDYLDSLRDTLVVDGAKGLDDRTWSFAYPQQSSGARVVLATAKTAMAVNVERQQNRLPA